MTYFSIFLNACSGSVIYAISEMLLQILLWVGSIMTLAGIGNIYLKREEFRIQLPIGLFLLFIGLMISFNR